MGVGVFAADEPVVELHHLKLSIRGHRMVQHDPFMIQTVIGDCLILASIMFYAMHARVNFNNVLDEVRVIQDSQETCICVKNNGRWLKIVGPWQPCVIFESFPKPFNMRAYIFS